MCRLRPYPLQVPAASAAYLECSFQGSSIVVAAAKHQEALLSLQLLRQLQHLGVQLEHLQERIDSAKVH